MNFKAVHVATLAFDNHQITLINDEVEILLRYKDRKDFDNIVVGDEVEVDINEVDAKPVKKVAAKKVAAKKK